ncbi:MAG: hypothetical protein WA110_07810 [Anaerolineaceae bacterium]
MTNLNFISIEEKLKAATQMPQPRPEFMSSLRSRLTAEPPRPVSLGERLKVMFRFPVWAASLVVLLLVAGILIAGPQRVYAEFMKLLGYIPGVGIVDQSSPIRVLAEPVTVTRDGISITVTSATLTGEMTDIEYRIFGVSGSAYPDSEDVVGCSEREYLLLADGSQLAQVNFGYQPVPTSVNEAVFVIPCISNTLPGKAPENWEIPLSFVAAPPDLTVMPVTELSPSPQDSLVTDAPEPPEEESNTPTTTMDSPVMVTKVIETSDGYILIGRYQPQSPAGGPVQVLGGAEIVDASGKKVSYTYPLDVNEAVNQEPPLTGWAVQFKAGGLVYPLTISFSGVEILPADPNATAEFTFDSGSNPQPGQEWVPDQDIQIAGHTLKLVSITANSQENYSFKFEGDPEVEGANVQILGYTPIGGGGGGGLMNGTFSRSLTYSQLPTGLLTVTISNLTLIGDPLTWQGEWTPERIRTDLPANPIPEPGVCLTEDSLAHLEAAPANLTNGKALLYEQLEGTENWGLVLYSLDGSGKQVVVPSGNWGSLSPDGSQVAYPAEDGIHVMDLATNTEKALTGAEGFDLHWSPDGTQIAYIGMGEGEINSVFVVNADGTQTQIHQISDWSYESVIGWSPDGSQLYFVVPFTGGAAWKVYGFDLASNIAQELFTIENGTPKALDPSLSPDGNWIAYRGRDNSSVYLVHPDGSEMHLVVDNAGAVGIEWSQSGWLGMSLRKENSDEHVIVLVKSDACEAYLLPADLHGDLEGLYIP